MVFVLHTGGSTGIDRLRPWKLFTSVMTVVRSLP